MTTPFERACHEICASCREATRMAQRGEKGHTLRFREDTGEFVHDFVSHEKFSHTFCYATALRIKNGRPQDR